MFKKMKPLVYLMRLYTDVIKFLFRQFRLKKGSKHRVFKSFADNNRLRLQKLTLEDRAFLFSFRDLTTFDKGLHFTRVQHELLG